MVAKLFRGRRSRATISTLAALHEDRSTVAIAAFFCKYASHRISA
jgi:hypothetical protein